MKQPGFVFLRARFMMALSLALAMIAGFAPEAGAATRFQIPTNRYLRPVGWPGGSTIEFRAGTIMADSFEDGVESGILANTTYLAPWNSSARIAFAAGTLIRFERTGGVLTGCLAWDSTLKVADSTMMGTFRANPATVTFGYDGGVASGVIAYSLWSGGRNYPADSLVSFAAGVVSTSTPWNPAASTPGSGQTEAEARFAGTWKGIYRNTLGGSGESVITLRFRGDRIEGDWDGSTMTNARVAGDLLSFSIADSANATTYAVEVLLLGEGRATMSYRVSGGRNYSGTVESLARMSSSPREAPDAFSGFWSGTYRNSLGHSGPVTLTLAVSGYIVTGDWDGATILDGKREGDTLTWRCYDAQNRNTYMMEFRLTGPGSGRLSYTVTGARNYSGTVDDYRRR
jgi:hypothetical protein